MARAQSRVTRMHLIMEFHTLKTIWELLKFPIIPGWSNFPCDGRVITGHRGNYLKFKCSV